MSAGVTIRGYASIFGQQFHPVGPHAMVVKPGAFDLSGSIPLCVDHQDHEVLATSADDMRPWQDSHGLAFEIDVTDDLLDKLARDVANGRRAAVSVGFASGRTATMQDRDGKPVEVVSRTRIDEISLLASGACPGARAWLAIGGQGRAPHELQNLVTRWNVGRQQRIVAAHRKAPTSDGRHVPASVHALLRSPAFDWGATMSAAGGRALQGRPA